MRECMNACPYIHTHFYLHTHTYISIHTYPCIHTHTYSYIHPYIFTYNIIQYHTISYGIIQHHTCTYVYHIIFKGFRLTAGRRPSNDFWVMVWEDCAEILRANPGRAMLNRGRHNAQCLPVWKQSGPILSAAGVLSRQNTGPASLKHHGNEGRRSHQIAPQKCQTCFLKS